MEILISEGKFDVWFFDELIKDSYDGQLYPWFFPKKEMPEIQRLIWENSGFEKANDFMLIYGDNGRVKTCNLFIYRLIITCLKHVEGTTNFNLIIDRDNSSHSNLTSTIRTILENIPNQPILYPPTPTLREYDNIFELIFRERGKVKLKLHTIHRSLEYQIVKKIHELKCPRDQELLSMSPHDALDLLALKYYSRDKESLIREAARELAGETWIQEILNSCLHA
ncbi:hypothetical protein BMS3Bbin16_01267 [archaeon BMS3Bbin16]|nr:hypothetical protein BMS3Bbin16_01267 [archaeon BMS3Bbin16]